MADLRGMGTKVIFVFCFFILTASSLFAANRTWVAGSGNWGTAANWNGGASVPQNGDSVTLSGAIVVTLDVTTNTLIWLEILNGAELRCNINTRNLVVTNAGGDRHLKINGAGSKLTVGSGTAAAGSITINGTLTVENGGQIIKNATGDSIICNGAVVVGTANGAGTIELHGDDFDLRGSAGNLTIDGPNNGKFVMDATDSRIYMGSGTYVDTGNNTTTGLVATAGRVEFNTAGGKIGSNAKFWTLRIGAATTINAGPYTVECLESNTDHASGRVGLDIHAGVLTANDATIKVRSWYNDGAGAGAGFTEGTSNVVFLASIDIPTIDDTDVTPPLAANETFYHLTIGEGASNSSMAIVGTGNLTVSGNLTIGTAGSALTNSSGNTIVVGGNWANSGNYTGTADTVQLNGVGKTVSGTTTFRTLQINAGKTYTLSSGAYVTCVTAFTNNLGGGASLSGSPGVGQNATLEIASGCTVTGGTLGTFTPVEGTFIWKRNDVGQNLPSNVANGGYWNLTLNPASGNVTPTGALTIANDFKISSGTFLANSLSHAIGGDLYMSGAFTGGGASTITFTKAGCEILKNPSSATSITFDNLTIGNSASDDTTIDTGDSVTVNGTFTIAASSTFNAGNSTTFTTGTWNDSGTFNKGTGTAVWKGATLPVTAAGNAHEQFYNLTIDSATAVLNYNLTVTKELKINNTKTLDAENLGGNTLYVGGDWTNNGAFTPRDSTVEFNGGVAQTLKGSAATSFNKVVVNKSSSTTLTCALGLGGDDVTVGGTLQIKGGGFDIGSDQVAVTGALTVGDGAGGYSDGTLYLLAACTLKLGASLTVNSDGTFMTAGSTPALTSTNPGVVYYSVTVNGVINISALNFQYMDTNGMTIGVSGDITSFDNVTFDNIQNAGATDTYVRILRDVTSPSYAYTFNGHIYNNTGGNANRNVFVNTGGFGVTITQDNSSGAMGGGNGETYDFNESGADPTPGNVDWRVNYVWEGDAAPGDTNGNGVADPNDWFIASNWSINQVPVAGYSAEIPNVANYPKIGGADVTVKNIVMAASSTLEVVDSSNLTYTNTWTLGAGANFIPGTGTVIVGGTGTNQTLPQETYYNIKVTNTTGVSVPPAGIVISGDSFTIDTGASFNAGSSTIRIKGNWINSGTFTPSTSIVYFEGTGAGTQEIDPSAFNNVIFTGNRTKLIEGNFDANGTVTIEDGVTLNATDLSEININIGGSLKFTNTDANVNTAGAFTPGLSTVIFDGGTTVEIVQENTGVTTLQFNNLKTLGTGTNLRMVTAAGGATTQAITINTIDNAGNINKGNINIGTGSTIDMTNDTVKVGGSWTQNGTVTATGSTVQFNASTSQEIKTDANFNNLTINNSHASQKVTVTASSGATVSVAGNLQVSDGILNLGTGVSINVTGTSTVAANCSLEIAKSTLRCDDNVTITGSLTMSGDGAGASTLKIGGGVSKSVTIGGTLTVSTTGIQPKITAVTVSGGPYYSFTVNGTIDVNGLDFEGSNNNGLTISNTATIVDIDNVDFQSLNGGAAINRAFYIAVTSGAYNFDNCTFDSTCTKNCEVPVGWTGTAINFTNFSGANSGSGFETDPPAKINWIANRSWVGGDIGNLDVWNRANNWTPVTVPTADTNVTIPNRTYDPKIDGARSARYVTVQNGAILYIDNTYSATPTLTVGSDFTIDAGGQVTMGTTANAALTVSGDWTNSGGTLNQTNGTITFGGANDIINSEPAFSRVTINGTSTLGDGAVVVCKDSAPAHPTHAFTINAAMTFKGGSNTNQATFKTDVWTNNGNAFVPGNSKFVWRSNNNVPLETFYDLQIGDNAAGINSTPTFALGAANRTVNNNLVIDTNSSLTLTTTGGKLIVKGYLWIKQGATLAAGAATIELWGDFIIDGTLTANTSKVTFLGGTTQKIRSTIAPPAMTFNNIEVQSGTTCELQADITVSNINSGLATPHGTIKLNSKQLTITGTWTDDGTADNLSEDTGTVYFNGTTQTLPKSAAGAGETFYNLKTGGTGAQVYTLGQATIVTNTVTIGANSTLDVSLGNNYPLSVGGDWTRNGTFNERSGTVTFNGTIDQNITTAANFNNITINNTGASKKVLAQGNLTIVGTLTMTAGRMELDTDGGGTLSHTAAAITANAGILDFSDANVAISGAVTINGGAAGGTLDLTTSPGGATIAFGSVTLGTGAVKGTLDMTGSTVTVSVGGNWSDSGTVNVGSSTVKFTANGSTITASGAGDFYKLEIAPGGGNTVTLASNVGADNNVTVTNGTLALSNRTLAVAGAVSNSGILTIGTGVAAGTLDLEGSFTGGTLTFVNGGASQMTFAGASFAPVTLNANDGTITFDNTSTGQNIPSFTYNHLKVAKSAQTATATGNLTTNGTFTVTSGVFNADNGAAKSHSFNAVTNNGTITIGNSGTTITVTNLLDNNATFNIGAGTVDANGNVDTTGGTLNFNGLTGTLRMAGTFTSTNAELVEGNGTVIFDGAGQTIPGLTYYNLKTGSVATTYLLGGNVITTKDFTIDETADGTNATLDTSPDGGTNVYNITVGGNWANNGNATSFVERTSTVTLNGTAAAITVKSSGESFNNLVVNTDASSVVSLSDNGLVGGTLTVTAGELNLGTGGSARTLTSTGAVSVTGKFDVNGGTITASNGLTVNSGGTLILRESGILKLANAKALAINGTLNTFWSSGTKPKVTTSGVVGTNFYSFDINAGATVEISGLTVESVNASGLKINSGLPVVNIQDIDDVAFVSVSNSGGTGGICLNMPVTASYASPQSFTFSNMTFDASYDGTNTPAATTANIFVGQNNTVSVVITMSNATDSGAPTKEGNDYDDGERGAGNALVNWIDLNTWIGNTTSWNSAGNWTAGIPDGSKDVLIPTAPAGGSFPTLDTTGLCRGLKIQTAASLAESGAGTYDLQISGDFTIEGTGTFTPGDGTVILNGTGTQTVTTGSLYKLTVDKASGTAIIGNSFTVTNNLFVKKGTLATAAGLTLSVSGTATIGDGAGTTNGILDLTAGTIDVTGTVTNTATYGTITFGASGNGTLRIRGGTFTSPSAQFSAGNGTVALRNVNFTDVPALTYYNFTLENDGDGTTEVFTLDGNIVVNNALTIGTLTQLQNYDGVTQFNITVGGAWTNNGVFTPTGGTVTFNGGSATITPGSGANDQFYNLTVNSTGTKTVATNPLDIDGILTVTAGTLNLSSIAGHTVAGTASVAGTLDVGTASIAITGAISISGTVDMDQNGVSMTCGGLTNTGSGTLDFGAGGNGTIGCSGEWSDSGATNPGNSTITLSGIGFNVSAPNSTVFYHLTISGTYTATSNLDIEGNVTISGTFAPGSYSHTVAGGWTDNGGVFTATAGTVTFDGTGAKTITTKNTAGGNSFYNLIVGDGVNSPAVTVAAGGDIMVGGNLTLNTGSTLTLNANTGHSVTGTVTLSGGTTTILNIATATLTVTGAITNGGKIDLSATTSTNGALSCGGLTNNETTTFGTTGAGTLTCNGNFNNSGASSSFVKAVSTFVIGGASSTVNAPTARGPFYHLTINGTATAIAALDVDGNLTINPGKSLNLGGVALTHDIAGTTTVTGTMDLSSSTFTANGSITVTATTGTLQMGNSSKIKMANGTSATINGTFTTSYTTTKPTFTSKTPGTDRYGFTVNGKMDINGLIFESANSSGMTISNSADPLNVDLDNVDFKTVQPAAGTGQGDGARHLYIGNFSNGTYTQTFDSCTFDTSFGTSAPNVGNNVIGATTTGSTIVNFSSYGGAGSGSVYEWQGTNADLRWLGTTTWEGNNSTDWNDNGNWSNGVPGAESSAIVLFPASARNPTMNVDGTCASLEIKTNGNLIVNGKTLTVNGTVTLQSTGTLTMTVANSTVQLSGNWTNNGGTLNHTAGKIIFNGTGSVIASETGFLNVEIANTKSASVGDGAASTSVAIKTGGTLTLGPSGNSTLTLKNLATLTTPDLTKTGTDTFTCDTGSSFVWIGSGAVPAETYYNLTVGNGVVAVSPTLSGSYTINNDMTVNVPNAQSLDAGGANVTIKRHLIFNHAGSFLPTTSNFTFNGGVVQNIQGTATPYKLNDMTVNNGTTVSLQANLTLETSGVDYGDLNTALVGTPGIVKLNSYTLEIQGTWTDDAGNDNLSEDTGTVYYNNDNTGAGINIPSETYKNVRFGTGSNVDNDTYVLSGATVVSGNVTIDVNSTFDVAAGNNPLSVGGDWTRNGTFNKRAGTVTFNGTIDQNITTTADFNNMTINNTGAGKKILAQGNLTITGTLTMTAGRFELDNDDGTRLSHTIAAITANAGVLDLSNADVAVSGAVAINGGAAAGGTLDLTMASAATITLGSVTVGTGVVKGTLDMTGSTVTVGVGGNWSDSGTVNVGSSTVKFTANGSTITASGAGDFYKLEIAPGGGNTVTLSSSVGVDNNVTVTSGTLALSNRTLAVAGAVSNSGTLTIGTGGAAGTLDLEGSFTGGTLTFVNGGASQMTFAGSSFAPATLNANDGTIAFDNTSTGQNVPSFTYNNLKVAKSAQTATAVGNLTTNGTLTVTSGIFNADDASDRSHTFSALTNNGTVTIDRAGTVITVTNLLDNNSTFNIGAATVDANGNVDTTGGTLNFNGLTGTLKIAGTFTSTNAELVEGNGTVIFDGAGQTIPGLTYYNLTTGDVTTTYTLGGDIVVTKNLINDSVAGGSGTATLDVSGSNRAISVGGDFTNNGTFTAQNGTVTLNGAAAAISVKSNASAFKNLVINVGSSSVVTTTDALSVGGTLTVSGGELDLGTGLSHSVTGTSSIGKVLDVNGSTLALSANMTVNAGGELHLDDAAAMRLSNGVGITISSGAPNGSFTTAYTSTKPTITGWPANGTARFAFTVNGTVDIGGLTVTYPDDNGLTVNSGATITAIDEVTWNNISATGTYLRILLNGAATYVLSKHVINGTFGGLPPYNVATAATAGLVIDMVNSSGNGGGIVNGPANDNPGAGSTINWKSTNNWTAGAATTSWNTAGNWSEGHKPLDTEDVLIPVVGGGIYPVMDVTGDCRNITIDGSGPSLNLNGNTLRVKGNLTNDGTFTHGNGTLAFNGDSQQTIGGVGAVTLFHMTVTNTSATEVVKPTKAIAIAGNVTINRGTFAANGQTIDITGNVVVGDGVGMTNGMLRMLSGTFTIDGSLTATATYGTVSFGAAGTGTLKLRGGTFICPSAQFTTGNGTVILRTVNFPDVPALTYYNLTLEDDGDGTTEVFTLDGNITVNNNLTIGALTQLQNYDGATQFAISVGGAWSNSGVFTPTGGTVTLTGNAANINNGSGNYFYNLTVNAAATKTIVTNKLDVNGTLKISAGTLDLGAGFVGASAHTVDGTAFPSVDIDAGTLYLNTSELRATSATGGVDIAASNSAIISMTANSTANPDFDVSGNFTINGAAQKGTLDLTASSATVRVAGSWSNSGTINIGLSTVTLTGTTKNITTANSSDFYNLTISGSYTAQNGIDIDGNMTISGTFTPGAFAHKVAGNWDDSAGTFAQTAGSVTFDKSSGAQTITTDSGTNNNRFYNLTIGDGTAKPSVVVAAAKDLEVSNNLTISADSSLTLNSNTAHRVGGNATINAPSAGTTKLDVSTGKLTVTGSVTNSGTVDMSSTASTAQGLICAGFTSTGTLTFGAGANGTLECNGNWTNTGTFTIGNSTVIIGGNSTAKAQAATGDFYNLTINGTVTLDGTATNGLDIDNSLVINSGKSLTLDAQTHDVAGTTTITGTLALQSTTFTANGAVTVTVTTGAFNLNNSAIFKAANAVSITVNGTLTTSYTTTKPKITSKTPGTDRYSFAVNGTINVAGLTFESPDNNGLTINQGATITDIDNADFTNIAGSAGSAFMKVQFTSGIYAGNYNACTFAAVAAGKYNVVTANTSGSTTLNFTNWSGAGAGDSYESEGTNGPILWIADATWTGAVDTAWNNGSNWSTGSKPGAGSNVIIPNKTSSNNRSPALNETTTVASLTVQNNGELVMGTLDDLTINGNLTIDGGATGGKITQSNAGAVLTVKSALTDNTTAGGINETDGKTIILAPTANINGTSFKNLEIGDGTQAVSVTLASTKQIVVAASGTLVIKNNATLTINSGTVVLGNGSTVTINSTGKLVTTGTAEIKSSTPGTDRFNFNVSGTVDLDGLTFRSGETNGLNILDSTKILKLRNVKFYNVKQVAGSAHLTVAGTSLNLDCPGCTFDAVSGGWGNSYNVKATDSNNGSDFIMRFEDRGAGTSGAGAGESKDSDADSNDDGTPDSPAGGAVVQWLYNSNLNLAGTIQGFPVAAYDFGTGAYYSTYVSSRNISGAGTADRIYVLNASGDLKNYSYDIAEAYGDLVGLPWAYQLGANYVVYAGTTTGYLFKLVDTLGALNLEAGYPKHVADEITSPIISDDYYLYFGGKSGAQAKFYVFSIAAQTVVSTWDVTSAIRTNPAWDTKNGQDYIFMGSDKVGANAKIYRFDVPALAVPLSNSTPLNHVTAPIMEVNERVHVGDQDGKFHGVDAFSAGFTNLANWATPYAASGSITAGAYTDYISNKSYFGDATGRVYLVQADRTNGAGFPLLMSDSSTINSTPLPLGGLLYIGNNNGKVYVIDESVASVYRTYDVGVGVKISTIAFDSDTDRLMIATDTGKVYYIAKLNDPTP